MIEINKISLTTITFLGKIISFNLQLLVMTWLVMAILIITALWFCRKIKLIPDQLQTGAETIITFFKDITQNTLGEKDGQRFFPLIFSLFIFIIISNWIGLIPNFVQFVGSFFALGHKFLGGDVILSLGQGGWITKYTNIIITIPQNTWYAFLFKFPDISEPTKFLSTDLALALIVFVTVHTNAIKSKNLINYLKSYMDPVPCRAPFIYFFFLNPFIYLNIIGECAKVVSHSFRLFGNIFGGSIIILIISELIRYLLLPVGLSLFFGLFSGLIQAFVFSMLALTYIAVAK